MLKPGQQNCEIPGKKLWLRTENLVGWKPGQSLETWKPAQKPGRKLAQAPGSKTLERIPQEQSFILNWTPEGCV